MKSKDSESMKINIDKKKSLFQKTSGNNFKKTTQRKNPKQNLIQKSPIINLNNDISKNCQTKNSPSCINEDKITNLNENDKFNEYRKSLLQETNDTKECIKIDSALISQKFKDQVNILKKNLIRCHSAKNFSEISKNSRECSFLFVDVISKVKNILSIGLKNPFVFLNDEIEKLEKLRKIQQRLDEFINKDQILFNQNKFNEDYKFKFLDPLYERGTENEINTDLIFYEIQQFYNKTKNLKIHLKNDYLINKSLKKSNSLIEVKNFSKNKKEVNKIRENLLQEEKIAINNRSAKRMEIYKRFFLVSTDCMKDISKVIKKEMKKIIDKKDKEKKQEELRDKILTPTFRFLTHNSRNNDGCKTRNHNIGNSSINVPTLDKEFNLPENGREGHSYIYNSQQIENPVNLLAEKTIILEPYRIHFDGQIQKMFSFQNNEKMQSSNRSNKLDIKNLDVKEVPKPFDQNENCEKDMKNTPGISTNNFLNKKNYFSQLAVTHDIVTYGGVDKKQVYENKSINCNISHSFNDLSNPIRMDERKNDISDIESIITKNLAPIMNSENAEITFKIKNENSTINEINSILSKANHKKLIDQKFPNRIGKESIELINFSLKREDEIFHKIEKLKDKFSTLQSNDEMTFQTPEKSAKNMENLLLESRKKTKNKKAKDEDTLKLGNSNRSFVTLKSSRPEEDTFIKSECNFINFIPDSIVKKIHFQKKRKSINRKKSVKGNNITDETLVIYDPELKTPNKLDGTNHKKINLSSCCSSSNNVFFEAKSHFDTNRIKNEVTIHLKKKAKLFESNNQIPLKQDNSSKDSIDSNRNENKTSCKVI